MGTLDLSKATPELIARLAEVQKDLKAPKNQYNSFGNYYYRSCEDILEGTKAILQNDEAIFISDEIKLVGDRHYVEATAYFCKGASYISVSASAREELTKKGMDASQVTGATSSYARKYALNGLLRIDDSKDADGMDNRNNGGGNAPKGRAPKDNQKPKDNPQPTHPEFMTDEQKARLVELGADMSKLLLACKVDSEDKITYLQAKTAIERKEKMANPKTEVAKAEPAPTKAPANKTEPKIDEEQIDTLIALGLDMDKLMAECKVDKVRDISYSIAQKAIDDEYKRLDNERT